MDTLALQRQLNALGFGPLAEDGIYGRATAAAYAGYLATHPADAPELLPPAPPAPKPWWTSRRVIGGVIALVAGFSGVARLGLDAQSLTDLAVQAAELIAAAIALWGGIRAQAPVDPGLVLPGLRLRDGRLQRVQQPPAAVPSGAAPAADPPPADRQPAAVAWDHLGAD